MSDSDLIVLGGGPAGAAVALLAARAGMAVAVLSRAGGRGRLLDTLAPETLWRLQGLSVPLASLPHVVSPGIAVRWESDTDTGIDAITTGAGEAWHVDRSGLDAALRSAAVAAGAVVVAVGRVTAVSRADDRWRVKSDVGTHRAAVLVDATGRRAWLRRRLGVPTLPGDVTVAVSGLTGLAATGDRRLAVEAVQDGWWSYTPRPGGGAVAAWMTDADRLPRDAAALRAAWVRSLRRASSVWERFGDDPPEHLYTAAAGHTVAAAVAGEGWRCVGDAALAPDPLSGSGLLLALDGATACLASLVPDEPAPYEDWFRAEAERYAARRHLYYARVRRWPNEPFWQRRQTSTASGGETDG